MRSTMRSTARLTARLTVPPTARLTVRLTLRLLVALLLLTSFTAGCKWFSGGSEAAPQTQRDQAKLEVSVAVDELVKWETPVTATVSVSQDGEAVSGATVELVGQMTHVGMPVVTATAVEVEPGVYRTDELVFSMPGDWVVIAEAKAGDTSEGRGERFVRVTMLLLQ